MQFSQKNQLKLLCDENVPKKVVKLLLKEGFDVKQPRFGSSDRKVAFVAKSEKRILLTFDKHFANRLLFPPEKYSGIVFIRIRPPLIKTVSDALLNLFASVKPSEFKGKLFTLSSIGYRVSPQKLKELSKRTK